MAAETKERIMDQARGLLAHGGKPTVAEIAKAAGVSRTGFYRAFESRSALLEELAVEPEPAARERILEASLDMVGAHGLNALSMDELAARAGVSRATLYRLFPGKPTLLTSLIKAYSPLLAVSQVASTMHEEPPEVVMPEIARTVYRVVYGRGATRLGLLRAIFFEVSSLSPDAEEAAQEAVTTLLGSVGVYLMSQMAAGRLRQMPPILALQAFIGPIFFHILTRPIAERLLGLDIPGEQAVTELAQSWLRAMQPSVGLEDSEN